MKRDESAPIDDLPTAADFAQWRSDIQGFVAEIAAELDSLVAAVASPMGQGQTAPWEHAAAPAAARADSRLGTSALAGQSRAIAEPEEQTAEPTPEATGRTATAEEHSGANEFDMIRPSEPTGQTGREERNVDKRIGETDARGRAEWNDSVAAVVPPSRSAGHPVLSADSTDRLESLRQQLAQRLRDVQQR